MKGLRRVGVLRGTRDDGVGQPEPDLMAKDECANQLKYWEPAWFFTTYGLWDNCDYGIMTTTWDGYTKDTGFGLDLEL